MKEGEEGGKGKRRGEEVNDEERGKVETRNRKTRRRGSRREVGGGSGGGGGKKKGKTGGFRSLHSTLEPIFKNYYSFK